jgi:hypothetical protein
MLMLKNRREELADAKFGVLPRWGLSDGQTGWRTDLLECGQLTVILPPGWRVVDEPQTASMGQILPVCTYSDQRSGSIVLFTAIRLDRGRETADIRDFEGAGASGTGALAWARRRNTGLQWQAGRKRMPSCRNERAGQRRV